MNRFLIPAALCVALILGGRIAPAVAGSAAPAPGDTITGALAPLGAERDGLRAQFGFVLRRGTAAATRVERLALVSFLRNALIPHAQAEELVLYPALDSVLGTRGYATATMILDHRAIASLTLELSSLVDGDAQAFERKAVALAALVEHHFANEEDFVLPKLAEKLNDRALRALLLRMDAGRVTQ